MLSDFGDLNFRNGSKVISTRDLVTSSRISSITAGMVYSISACPRRVDMGGTFFMIGPASMTRLCIDFGVSVAILFRFIRE